MTRKEKRVLFLIQTLKSTKNATQTVNALKEVLKCAPSTIWRAIRSLRTFGLVEYKKGKKSMSVSPMGNLLAQEAGENEGGK